MTRPPGVILAGGLATRMGGGDKGRLSLGDRSILDHVIARIAPQVDGLALNGLNDSPQFAPAALAEREEHIVQFFRAALTPDTDRP